MDVNTVAAVAAVLLLASTARGAAASKTIPSFAGPYVIYIKRLLPCSDNDTVWRQYYGNMRFSHYNPGKPHDAQIVTGTFTVPVDVDDTFWIGAKVDKRANNQWKKNYFVFNNFPVGFCSTMRANIPEPFAKVFGSKSMTGRCSVRKGSYTVDHEPIHWNLPNFPTLPYGNYFVKIKGEQRGAGNASLPKLFELCGECETVPKP
ncbi:uncharacterized protein LOC117647059 [Thrips palmi]|uniref:Uncharacterized protein LOC117647059 n=1 Tax=Thrips palmi TaxID=161013 RepID=A0A6P8Z327_THRPL|nr:uncharacterized protein LOC117647059 [Thrips palmi]XP_034244435.1 uncharacterized protein LOC117647059 [Thrips palmi]